MYWIKVRSVILARHHCKCQYHSLLGSNREAFSISDTYHLAHSMHIPLTIAIQVGVIFKWMAVLSTLELHVQGQDKCWHKVQLSRQMVCPTLLTAMYSTFADWSKLWRRGEIVVGIDINTHNEGFKLFLIRTNESLLSSLNCKTQCVDIGCRHLPFQEILLPWLWSNHQRRPLEHRFKSIEQLYCLARG